MGLGSVVDVALVSKAEGRGFDTVRFLTGFRRQDPNSYINDEGG